MSEVWLSGTIVSEDPFIFYSSRMGDVPIGIAGVYPEYFQRHPALHLVSFSWSAENGDVIDIEKHVRRLEKELPHNHFVVLCGTEMESYLLSRVGVPAIVASPSIFIDIKQFRVLERAPEPRFDAIYNARLTPFKRHNLAAKIPRLGLIYGPGWPAEPTRYEETRALLPQAYFANHEMGGGNYRSLSPLECTALMNASHTGLALSAVEGLMRAAVEYLLCGLPVVSTRSIGGRERYFQSPFATIVPDDPGAVAQAVRAYVENPIPRQDIRTYIVNVLDFERHCFLLALNAIVKDLFGVANHFKTFPATLWNAYQFRSSKQIKAVLDNRAAKGPGGGRPL